MHLFHLIRAVPHVGSKSAELGLLYVVGLRLLAPQRPSESGRRLSRSDGQTLALRHDACRESALHGLGHWHRAYPAETERIIDDFLATNQGIREELLRYALAARSGCIQ